MEIVSERLILELGTLKVYEVMTTEAGRMYKGIYWRDPEVSFAQGPFKDLYEAMSHHTDELKRRKELKEVAATSDRIIMVDFVSKKRVYN